MSDPTLKCTARFIVPVILVLLMGCSADEAVTAPDLPPPPPPLPACEVNNTATAEFRNLSNSNSTHDIIWNGSKLYTVPPAGISETLTVAAGIQHTLVFQFTNTSTNACTPSTPTLAQCSNRFYSCTG